MDQRLQKLVLSQTVDLDIANAMFVVVRQMLDRLEIVDKAQWAEEMSTLVALAERRDELCRSQLQTTVAHGKRILHSVVFGGGVPEALADNVFLKKTVRTHAACVQNVMLR